MPETSITPFSHASRRQVPLYRVALQLSGWQSLDFCSPTGSQGNLGQVSCAMLVHCGPCSSTLKVWAGSPGIPALDQYHAQGHEMHQLGDL